MGRKRALKENDANAETTPTLSAACECLEDVNIFASAKSHVPLPTLVSLP